MTDKSIAQVLWDAADLIELEGAWTQGEFARDADGTPLANGYDPMAVCWCALGAVEHVAGGGWLSRAFSALERVGVLDVVGWNDEGGQTAEQVSAKLREAATLVEEQAL